jgi:hypothetical protein
VSLIKSSKKTRELDTTKEKKHISPPFPFGISTMTKARRENDERPHRHLLGMCQLLLVVADGFVFDCLSDWF